MVKKAIYIIIAGLILSSCAPKETSASVAAEESKRPADPTLAQVYDIEHNDSSIVWLTIAQAERLTDKSPKKIYVDFYTEWCGGCKVMDKKTFTDADVISYMNKNFYAVKFDAESTTNVTFNGVIYNRHSGMNGFAGKVLGPRAGFPTSAFFGEDKSVLEVAPGFKDAGKFMNEMKRINSYQ
jgi:thiol:disulfide interchange protein